MGNAAISESERLDFFVPELVFCRCGDTLFLHDFRIAPAAETPCRKRGPAAEKNRSVRAVPIELVREKLRIRTIPVLPRSSEEIRKIQ